MALGAEGAALFEVFENDEGFGAFFLLVVGAGEGDLEGGVCGVEGDAVLEGLGGGFVAPVLAEGAGEVLDERDVVGAESEGLAEGLDFLRFVVGHGEAKQSLGLGWIQGFFGEEGPLGADR